MRQTFLCLVGCAAIALSGCAGSIHAELKHAKRAKKQIFIGHLYPGRPDKKGNVSAHIQIFNTSDKVYKYVDLSIVAYNRVGDVVQNSFDPSPTVKLRFTGPLAPRRTPGTSTWAKAWQISTIACLTIQRIDLFHMDGTAITIEGPDLTNVLAQKLIGTCPKT